MYDFKQLQVLAAGELAEPHTEGPPVARPPGAIELELWPDTRLFDVAYKPDEPRSTGPVNKKPPPRRTNEKKSSQKPRRPPPTRDQIEANNSPYPPKRTTDKPSRKFREAAARIRNSRVQLTRVTDEIAALRVRIERLDPTLKATLVTTEFVVDWDHLADQLATLNAMVQQHPDRFEIEMGNAYEPLMDRIIAITLDLDALENPQLRWDDTIPKTIASLRQRIRSIKLP